MYNVVLVVFFSELLHSDIFAETVDEQHLKRCPEDRLLSCPSLTNPAALYPLARGDGGQTRVGFTAHRCLVHQNNLFRPTAQGFHNTEPSLEKLIRRNDKNSTLGLTAAAWKDKTLTHTHTFSSGYQPHQ